ncbi:hypothetical protein VTN00DRAFT_645 [Thermoascus crustaceus]|uniref:uncharacterized protein n=1 Tax=Thermoascus crustaceus TaxID=5088 RepID=UPI0037424464
MRENICLGNLQRLQEIYPGFAQYCLNSTASSSFPRPSRGMQALQKLPHARRQPRGGNGFTKNRNHNRKPRKGSNEKTKNGDGRGKGHRHNIGSGEYAGEESFNWRKSVREKNKGEEYPRQMAPIKSLCRRETIAQAHI